MKETDVEFLQQLWGRFRSSVNCGKSMSLKWEEFERLHGLAEAGRQQQPCATCGSTNPSKRLCKCFRTGITEPHRAVVKTAECDNDYHAAPPSAPVLSSQCCGECAAEGCDGTATYCCCHAAPVLLEPSLDTLLTQIVNLPKPTEEQIIKGGVAFIMGDLGEDDAVLPEPIQGHRSTSPSDHLPENAFPRPARRVSVFYGKFREQRGIHSGIALTFNEWMDFAEEWGRSQEGSLQDFLETTGKELGRRTNLLDSALADIKEAAKNELAANSRTIDSLNFDEVQGGQRTSGEGVDRPSSPLARQSLNDAVLPEGQPQNEKEFRARYLNEWPISDTSGEGKAPPRILIDDERGRARPPH